MLGARRRVPIALTDAAPQEFAGFGAPDVDKQSAGNEWAGVVRTVPVIVPVAIMTPISISPSRPPPIAVGLAHDLSVCRDVHIGMNVITSQAPHFELRGDRGICPLPIERTIPGCCAIRPDITWCARHYVECRVPGSCAIRPDWCSRLYREGSYL